MDPNLSPQFKFDPHAKYHNTMSSDTHTHRQQLGGVTPPMAILLGSQSKTNHTDLKLTFSDTEDGSS